MVANVITVNRKAYHDYQIMETVEAGLVLLGTEIKSIRQGKANLRPSFAQPKDGELWLMDAHIAPPLFARSGILGWAQHTTKSKRY